MGITKRIKNAFTKGAFKNDVEFTGNTGQAADELKGLLIDFRVKIESYRSISGAVHINKRTNNLSRDFFEHRLGSKFDFFYYKTDYVRPGAKSDQIGNRFKKIVTNSLLNKGGIFSECRNWTKAMYSRLNSIASEANSELSKIEKEKDKPEKHWKDYVQLEIDTFEKVKEAFNPTGDFTPKFMKNKNSRLYSENVRSALESLVKKIGEMQEKLKKVKDKIDKMDFDQE